MEWNLCGKKNVCHFPKKKIEISIKLLFLCEAHKNVQMRDCERWGFFVFPFRYIKLNFYRTNLFCTQKHSLKLTFGEILSIQRCEKYTFIQFVVVTFIAKKITFPSHFLYFIFRKWGANFLVFPSNFLLVERKTLKNFGFSRVFLPNSNHILHFLSLFCKFPLKFQTYH